MTLFVIPNERSDRGASPKGARDLPLVRTPSSPRSFGHTPGLRMTTLCPPEDLFFCRPEQRDREASPKGKDLDFAFACRPERTKRGGTSFLVPDCLRGEIPRPRNWPRDDTTLSSRASSSCLSSRMSGAIAEHPRRGRGICLWFETPLRPRFPRLRRSG